LFFILQIAAISTRAKTLIYGYYRNRSLGEYHWWRRWRTDWKIRHWKLQFAFWWVV